MEEKEEEIDNITENRGSIEDWKARGERRNREDYVRKREVKVERFEGRRKKC